MLMEQLHVPFSKCDCMANVFADNSTSIGIINIPLRHALTVT